MKKYLFVLFFLVFSSMAIKMDHVKGKTTPAQPAKPATNQTEQAAAMERFMAFIMSDKDLSQAMFSGKNLTSAQTQRLVTFVVNDKYFQKQIFAQIQKGGKEVAWFKGLSQAAKVRFLSIVINAQSGQQKKGWENQLLKKLLADPEIGPALKKQYGNNVNTSILSSTKTALASSVKAHHDLASLYSHLVGLQ